MSLAALLKPQAKAGGREPFFAFAVDERTRSMLSDFVHGKKWPEASVREGGVSEATESLSSIRSPERLVVDLTGAQNPLEAINVLAEVCEPGTVVVAIGETNDIALYRALVEAGVSDYLVKPIAGEVLERALYPVEEEEEEDEDGNEADGARLTLVVGTRGGVGASTVAVNMAWLIAHEHKKKVVLVDLDLQFGSVSLALDLEPGRGLREAVQNPDRIDGLFLERSLVRESETLSVLGAEEGLDQDIQFDDRALDHLFGELGGSFGHIVADMPRCAVPQHRDVLGEAKRLILVTDLSLGGLRDTVRLRNFFRECAPETKLAIVANRVAAKNGSMSKSEFERGLESKVDHVVPEDTRSVVAAVNAGKLPAQIAGRTKLVGEIRALASWVSGGGEKLESNSFFRRLVAKK